MCFELDNISYRGEVMDILDLNYVKSLLANSKNCLLGVSGGVDSMVLLNWLTQHKNDLPPFTVMHIDHNINQNSNSWANLVSSRCNELKVDCKIIKVDITGFGNNLEYAARRARYKAFCESGADTLILAHHANDQCESFLLKLFRGSGIRGLKAMSPITACWYDKNVSIVRPMLGITRTQIEYYAHANDIRYIDDPSNKDNGYDRNYIRNLVWPVIQDKFDIADINTIRSISHLSEAWELTSELARLDLTSVTNYDNTLDWHKTKDMGYLRIKNMILHILDQNNVYNFSVHHVEQFAKGIIVANLDSRNELRLKDLVMYKVGKKIHVEIKQQRAA